MVLSYFAYGSNMLLDRMRERVPSARALGRATLEGYALRFNKLSKKDDSAKANIVPSTDPRAVVHGVLYQIEEGERPRLDRAEGLGNGYEIRQVRVTRDGAAAEEAFTYVASPEAIRDDSLPFRSYKEMVVQGAIQNQLPESYVAMIRAVEAVEDPGRS